MAARSIPAQAAASRSVLRELRRIVGKGNVLTSPADLALYAYDSSLERHPPEVVVFPDSTDQVAQVVRVAAGLGVPFVPRGAGTNLSGGSVPVSGGIVIALSRLNRLLGIDVPNRCAVVQPGMTNLALQDALAPLGWVFHPDPASQKVSTVGGNVAENAGGPHCLKYGVTTNHVLGVKVVLPDAEVAQFGGAAVDQPGYDLAGLMNGSEGTLGIVTEATVRISAIPESVRTLLAVFDSMDTASEAVSAIIAAGIVPAALEMIDRVMVGAIQASMDAGYPTDAEAVLIVEVDGLREAVDEEARRSEAICRQHGAREVRSAASEHDRERLWAGRRGAFGAAARLASAFLVNDGVVPRDKLPEVLRQTQEIAARYGVRVGNNFHAGDGNLHPLILLDDRDPDQRDRAKRASLEMLEACVAAGGSISGEHGIGLEKREAMARFLAPAELNAHFAVKRSFDPRGLCNPGKMLPDEIPDAKQAVPHRVAPRAIATEPPPDLVIDERRPKALLSAGSEQDVAALLAGAAEDGAAIIPVGSRTKLDLGMPPRQFDYALSLDKLTGVIEHDVEDLTATVRAGTRLADLQAELGRRGQWVPLDPPHRDATVGGIIATDSYGPGRMRYGGCRDRVLGMRIALPSGEVISVGGKTVKNVTGYDLPKLFIGSLGTLGIITAATFKLMPVAERTEWSAWAFAHPAQAVECAQRLASSQLELSAAEVLTGDLVGHADAWVLLCRAQETEAAVERQIRAAADVCEATGGAPLADSRRDWSRIASDGVWRWRESAAIVRIATPPAALLDVFSHAYRLLGENGACVCSAGPALGIARVAFDGESAGPAVLALREAVEQRRGRLVIERAPIGAKLASGTWGTGHPGENIMRALKAEFDPKGVLSPGRFVGGI
ncbi:MAG: FAD-binding protein [Armatimonadota bacterium]|nr:MAG: FAD-binding protein [Armatimonadota bacterium]